MFSSLRRSIALAAVAGVALTTVGCSPATPEADEPVTLNFAWWGNDDRAARYEQAIDLFEEENPLITINGSFADYGSHWQKRNTEAAGGGLPDVIQTDPSYLEQYGGRGLYLDLASLPEGAIDISGIDEQLLKTGELDGVLYSVPTGTNTLGLFQNPDLAAATGEETFTDGDWDDYIDYMDGVSQANQGVWGGVNFTYMEYVFEIWLRQQGKTLYAEDGLGYTKDDLAEFWSLGRELIESGAAIPQERSNELTTGAFSASLTTSEFAYDNFLPAFQGELSSTTLVLSAPPTSDESVKDLYLKPAMQLTIAASTDHPEAAAAFVDFLTNDPRVGQIFGASRGIPADAEQRESLEVDAATQAVIDFEESVADRLGEPPAAPPLNAGTVGNLFAELGKSIALGAVSVDDAVDQLFAEAEATLGK